VCVVAENHPLRAQAGAARPHRARDWAVLVLLSLLLVACTAGPKHVSLVRVSEQNLNLATLTQIIREGEALCSRERGLKAIEWPFDPNIAASYDSATAKPGSAASARQMKAVRERRAIARLMALYAPTAPRRHTLGNLGQAQTGMAGGYLCQSGVSVASTIEFVP
jgi:hypothetical protein